MNDSFKQRLVGAVVLFALALILWPVVMGPQRDQSFVLQSDIPDKPDLGPSAIVQPKTRDDMSPIGEYQRKVVEEVEQQEPPEPRADEPIAKPRSKPSLDEQGLPVGWEIQVGSFGRKENATKLKLRLQKMGYRPQLAKNGKLTRVFIGPYIDKAIAQRNLDRIARQQDLSPKLVRFIPPNE